MYLFPKSSLGLGSSVVLQHEVSDIGPCFDALEDWMVDGLGRGTVVPGGAEDGTGYLSSRQSLP